MIYAQRLSEDPFWPIGLCVAYVLGGDPSEATQLYARHRLGNGVIHVDGWVGARTSLLRALTAGKIEALGVRRDNDQRVLIPAHEWIDLRIQQRGPYDEVGRADGSIAYRDVKVGSAGMRAEWPAPEAAKAEVPDKQESEAVERPAETPAMKRARDRHENERACQEALMERMRAIQTTPSRKRSYGWNSPRSRDALSINSFVKQFAKPDALPGAGRADAARKGTRTDSAAHPIRTHPVDSYARSNRRGIESVLRRLHEFPRPFGLDNRRG